MNAFIEQEPFVVKSVVGGEFPSLFESEEAAPAEEHLLQRLDNMPAGALLVIDFQGVRISSEAARQLLRRAIRRVTGGELPDRYFVVRSLGRSRYNVEVMAESEDITLVERTDEGKGGQLVGKVEPAMRETYEFLLTRSTVTAKEVFEHFGLNSVSAATNRLTSLAKAALVRRVAEQPVAGGGKQFVYAAAR
ncbi:MAG TPA: hypothetical protein VE913_12950 [Longimicrobium sp.]|nr:hypothetical protein [Longimicrobium sp.]